MIVMRRRKGSWAPVRNRNYAATVVTVVTLSAIIAFSLGVRHKDQNCTTVHIPPERSLELQIFAMDQAPRQSPAN